MAIKRVEVGQAANRELKALTRVQRHLQGLQTAANRAGKTLPPSHVVSLLESHPVTMGVDNYLILVTK